MGAPQADGLGNAKASEPHSGLGPTGAIPSAFTPGPWEVVTNRYGEHVLVATDTDENIFLLDDTEAGHDHDVYTANARLIAAAPELYEAVRLFLAYDASDDAEGVQMMLDYNTALTAAKAAFAKAGDA
jgi:hypothetical protein